MGSEYGEDLWIMQHIKLPDTGFYLDLGCAWPEMNSNSAFLRKRGWRGLCVDANPLYAQDWKGVEAFICAVVGNGRTVKFQFADAPDLSRVSNTGFTLPTLRLDDMLQGWPPVDLASVDLEGQEFEALRAFPWERQKPKCIVGEFNTHGIGVDFRVRDMLLPMGYKAVHQTVANIIFELQ